MQLKMLAVAIVLAATPVAHAQSAPDPLFGDDPHAKAVLDYHADYARRFARATIRPQATPTEIATAAYAHCIGQLNDFSRSVAATANSSDILDIALDRREYQATQNQMMREYAFAYTLDVYLSSTSF